MPINAFNGKFPRFDESVYIDETAVIIGDVTLGADVSIWPTAVVRGDVEKITIGKASNIQDGCILHVSHAGQYSQQGHPLIMGEGVTLGHRAVVHASTIGNYCLIGIGAIVLDDAILEDYVMLGAGSLVPPAKKLYSGNLYFGAPAKLSRALTPQEKAFLEYSAQHYVSLKNRYLVARHKNCGHQ